MHVRIGDVINVYDDLSGMWIAHRVTWAHPRGQLLRLGGMRLSKTPLTKIRPRKNPKLFDGLPDGATLQSCTTQSGGPSHDFADKAAV